jgi:nucleoside 2-deoxyribosyltransferase
VTSHVHVAGGTYREICRETELGAVWDELFGSGLRSAIVLRHLGAEVRLSTFVGDDQLPALEASAQAWDIALEREPIAETLRFSYAHALARPFIDPPAGALSQAKTLTVVGSNVLRFGMLEGEAVIKAERVVYDPQSNLDPRAFQENGSSAKELVIVANRREGQLLTGKSNLTEIGSVLLKEHKAQVAVLKLGASGARVFTPGGDVTIPAYRTTRVFPIGSGDVFSAVFAFAWMVEGLDPQAAANRASMAVARYCTRPRPPGNNVSDAHPVLTPVKTPSDGRIPRVVYLAGPFFTTGQRWVIAEARQALLAGGVQVFSPYHDVGLGPAEMVAPKDLEGLQGSDCVLAIVDGFDPGTLFEAGYAAARNIPTVVLVQNSSEEPLKMLQGSGCVTTDDFASAIYLAVWTALENSQGSAP